jgi:uncharacterized membrane protein YecN with MAPEG domain
MPPLPVTATVASVLALLFLKLSWGVITLRRRHRVSLGSGGHDDLERAIRAQGNFSEYVPLCLLLIASLELNGAPWWLVALPGAALIVGRAIHAKGIHEPPPRFSNRIRGMKLTLTALLALAILNLGWVTIRFATA